MCEKLLIRRCANFVPSIHLKNGVFGIKGHCVTFPQDITKMCDELPQRKETLITFIRNIGNKDTSAVFPKSMTVNRRKVLEALMWLKKHNIFYKNITIKEEHLDWMGDAEEVNFAKVNGIDLQMKESKRLNKKELETEHVSPAHSTSHDHNDDSLTIQTVHANNPIPVPTGQCAAPIKELIDIAQKTEQTSKIMDFPPIDHDSAVS